MRDIIQNFLNINKEFIPLQVQPLIIYQEILKDFGYEADDNDDTTNGWQVDFWYGFINKEGNKLQLRGSLWHGKYQLCKI